MTENPEFPIRPNSQGVNHWELRVRIEEKKKRTGDQRKIRELQESGTSSQVDRPIEPIMRPTSLPPYKK